MTSRSGAQFEADGTPLPSGQARSQAAVREGGENGELDLDQIASLFVKARDGDRIAYGQIVIVYQDRLFNGLLRMVGNVEETRELTQETFTRGLEKIGGFRGESSPYTWLFRIGMNLAINHLRRYQRQRTFSLDGRLSDDGGNHEGSQAAQLIKGLADRAESPLQATERIERHEKVLAALSRLDPEYRAVLVMRDGEGFDYQQKADVLGLPLGTLKSRLFRARMALRDELADYFSKRRK